MSPDPLDDEFEAALAELQDETKTIRVREENFEKWYAQFIADEAAGLKAWTRPVARSL